MLEVSDIHAGYGRIPVLSGINFTVGEHEVVGVLGHNGMGKTTLLKTLIGQVPLTSGRIRLANVDISHSPPFRRARAGLGYVPQGRQIFPGLSVYENLRMGFVENGIDFEELVIKDILARFPRLDPLDRSRRQRAVRRRAADSALSRAACAAAPSFCSLTSRPRESSRPLSKRFSTS